MPVADALELVASLLEDGTGREWNDLRAGDRCLSEALGLHLHADLARLGNVPDQPSGVVQPWIADDPLAVCLQGSIDGHWSSFRVKLSAGVDG